MSWPFRKGHGTENDFVLLPDPDGSVHGDLPAARVRAICDRRAGLGGDGVIRVIRTAALAAIDPDLPADSAAAEWFMDYRNSDGSVSEMCGNGVRVLALHLVSEALVDPGQPVPIGTRGGLKTVTFDGVGAAGAAGAEGHLITVDMGEARIGSDSRVSVGDRSWATTDVDMGNPHAVAFVDELADAGALYDEPGYDHDHYPHGVNIEFVRPMGPRHVAMRVHERGSGETRSCGTGACAVMVAAALRDGAEGPPTHDLTYRVDVPGGELAVTWRPDNHVLLTGPAVIVARGDLG